MTRPRPWRVPAPFGGDPVQRDLGVGIAVDWVGRALTNKKTSHCTANVRAG